MNQLFGKTFKICETSHYTSVFSGSDFRVSSPHTTVLIKYNNLGYSRIGVIVGKKAIKKAVDRNKAKRVIKESFRVSHIRSFAFDIVVIVRDKTNLLSKEQLNKNIEHLWKKIEKTERNKKTTHQKNQQKSHTKNC